MTLPTTEQIHGIDKHIDNGNIIGAIKVFRDITRAGLANSKRIIDLQTQGLKSLQLDGDAVERHDKTVKELNDRLERMELQLRLTQTERNRAEQSLKEVADQMQNVENERDEYKSRLNAMRTTAGLEPLSTQNAPNPDSEFLTVDPEIGAMSNMVDMLAPMDPEARCRVLDYLQRRFE